MVATSNAVQPERMRMGGIWAILANQTNTNTAPATISASHQRRRGPSRATVSSPRCDA